jgi:hypothetical protein
MSSQGLPACSQLSKKSELTVPWYWVSPPSLQIVTVSLETVGLLVPKDFFEWILRSWTNTSSKFVLEQLFRRGLAIAQTNWTLYHHSHKPIVFNISMAQKSEGIGPTAKKLPKNMVLVKVAKPSASPPRRPHLLWGASSNSNAVHHLCNLESGIQKILETRINTANNGNAGSNSPQPESRKPEHDPSFSAS